MLLPGFYPPTYAWDAGAEVYEDQAPVPVMTDQQGLADATAVGGDTAVYDAVSFFDGRPAYRADGATRMSTSVGTNRPASDLIIIGAFRWNTVSVRNVIYSQEVGGSIDNKLVLGTDNRNAGDGGPTYVVMTGDGSQAAHITPASAPGADGGDRTTAFPNEDFVFLAIHRRNGNEELWVLTDARGWEQLIDGPSGANTLRGFTFFAREDNQVLTRTNGALSAMYVYEWDGTELNEYFLAAKELAQWCHIVPLEANYSADGYHAIVRYYRQFAGPWGLDPGDFVGALTIDVTGADVYYELWILGELVASGTAPAGQVTNVVHQGSARNASYELRMRRA